MTVHAHTMTDHITMMKTPDLWPSFRLPLTRPMPAGGGPFDDQGIMVAGEGCKVFVGNMFLGWTGETIEYPDMEAIYDAGWRVD